MMQNPWDTTKSVEREVQSNTILPQEKINISNKQPKVTPKATQEK